MSNTDRDSMLERWADGMERLEQYYEGIYGPPATPPSLPPITTRDAMLEAIADGMERAKRNINKKSPTYHSDSIAYVKTVPAGNVHYASLEQIGGKTLVFNQVIPDPTMTDATKWTLPITPANFTKTASNNVLRVERSTSSNSSCVIVASNVVIVPNHIYYITAEVRGDVDRKISLSVANQWIAKNATTNFARYDSIITASSSISYQRTGIVVQGVDLVGLGAWVEIKNLWVCDLTLMYGAGNEPSTVAEFQQTFPAVWYAFNKGTLLSAGVTSVVSKKADTTEIATYSIPAEVQALEGYGWSAGSVYNYIDFERKVFVQNVGFVDLSALTWGYGPSVGWSATLPNVKNPADDDTAFNGLSATLKVTDRNTQATAFSGGTDAGMVSVAGGKVYVGTGSISIVPSGTLIYELDEPVETDISAYLTDDGLIEVEAGGTLEFPNQNGNDYRIPVPSAETFVVGEP